MSKKMMERITTIDSKISNIYLSNILLSKIFHVAVPIIIYICNQSANKFKNVCIMKNIHTNLYYVSKFLSKTLKLKSIYSHFIYINKKLYRPGENNSLTLTDQPTK